MKQTPCAALLVIGNEILSGRTKDKNIPTVACGLFAHGIDLNEIRVVADTEADIIDALHALMPKYDYVFTTGGIGPTHDDITAECIAKACNVPYGLHAEANAILIDYYQECELEYSEARRKMAHMPLDSVLIPNPISGAPGFQCQNVYVLPGVPHIMEQMFQELLHNQRIPQGARWHVCSVIVYRPESEIAQILQKLVDTIPDVEIGSYPRQDSQGRHLVNVLIRHRDETTLQSVSKNFMAQLETKSILFAQE